MGSLLEKIRLYDLLGYLLPGCVLNVLIEYAMQGRIHKLIVDMFDGDISFGWFVFLLLSYVEGIVLSEVSRNLIKVFRKWKKLRKDIQSGYDNKQIATVLAAYQNGDRKKILDKLNEGNGLAFYMPVIWRCSNGYKL